MLISQKKLAGIDLTKNNTRINLSYFEVFVQYLIV